MAEHAWVSSPGTALLVCPTKPRVSASCKDFPGFVGHARRFDVVRMSDVPRVRLMRFDVRWVSDFHFSLAGSDRMAEHAWVSSAGKPSTLNPKLSTLNPKS